MVHSQKVIFFKSSFILTGEREVYPILNAERKTREIK